MSPPILPSACAHLITKNVTERWPVKSYKMLPKSHKGMGNMLGRFDPVINLLKLEMRLTSVYPYNIFSQRRSDQQGPT